MMRSGGHRTAVRQDPGEWHSKLWPTTTVSSDGSAVLSSLPSHVPDLIREGLPRRIAVAFLRTGVWCAFWILSRMTVEGAENVPKEGAVIMAPNHVSAADWPAVGLASPRQPWFMAKAELFDIPLLGPLIRFCHAYPVKRGTADRASLRWTEELLRHGQVVVIFPEGQVSPDARLQPLKPGLAFAALRTGATVIPVALLGTERLLPHGYNLPRFIREPLIVRFGPAVRLDDLREPGRETPSRAAVDAATDRLAVAIQALLDEAHPAACQECHDVPAV